MKLGNKQILVILVASAFISVAVFGYLSRAASPLFVTGYMVLKDQKVSALDYEMIVKNFTAQIYLPSGNGEGSCTACGFTFPAGVDARADVTGDGRIDIEDLLLYQSTVNGTLVFGSAPVSNNWNSAFGEECFFTISGREIKDPTRDCKINQSDIDFASNPPCYGQVVSKTDDEGCAKADVNKDGKIDGKDVAMIAGLNGKYADTYRSYEDILVRNLDFNGDGKIDGKEIATVSINFNKAATDQTCQNVPLTYVGGDIWQVNVPPMRGLNYVSCSWKVATQ